jgi:hypothetical protein
MEGWIKLHRKLLNWEWYSTPNMVHLFIYLLLSANHQNKKWQGVDIQRGQLMAGRNKISAKTGISVQSVRTCLANLQSTNEMTIKSTKQYSIITICKYEDYQINEKECNQVINQVSNQQTNQRVTTNKNDKEEKNKEKEEEKEKEISGYKIDPIKEKEIEEFNANLLSESEEDNLPKEFQ